jgi:predicted dehydrogenase
MKRVKIGVVGCGSAVKIMYGPMFKYLEGGEFTAAMDIDESVAKWAQSMYGAKKIYTDLDEMLENADIEAVIIATPPAFHEKQVIMAAKSGKHILCEKPLGRTIEECDNMIKACRENNVLLMIGFMKRFNRCFKLAKEMIEKGKLGNVFEVKIDWGGSSSGILRTEERLKKWGWKKGLASLGGVLQDCGTHTLDLCRWWLGEIKTVSGEAFIVDNEGEVEDQAIAICHHENGGVSLHCIGFSSQRPYVELFEINGTKTTLRMKNLGRTESWTTSEPLDMKLYKKGHLVEDITPLNLENIDLELKKNNQFLKELEHFCKCVRTDKKVSPDGEDGKKAIEVVNAIYLSSWRNEKINLPLEKTPDLKEFFEELRNKTKTLRQP